MRKRPYLGLWASNQKNKTMLFPSTFKIEENKVVLFFLLKAQGLRYGHFLILQALIYMFLALAAVNSCILMGKFEPSYF